MIRLLAANLCGKWRNGGQPTLDQLQRRLIQDGIFVAFLTNESRFSCACLNIKRSFSTSSCLGTGLLSSAICWMPRLAPGLLLLPCGTEKNPYLGFCRSYHVVEARVRSVSFDPDEALVHGVEEPLPICDVSQKQLVIDFCFKKTSTDACCIIRLYGAYLEQRNKCAQTDRNITAFNAP